jgi:muconolactone delta-isomerase
VPLFIADWTIDGMTAERLVDFRHLLQDAADRVASRGVNVRYMRCTHVPEQSRCICLFDADDIEAVRSVNQIAQVPFAEISFAVEFYQASRSNTTEP